MPRLSPAPALQHEHAEARTVEVTYVPINRDDPHTMRWNGITFKANVPVVLDRDNPAHSYEGLLPEYVAHPITGGRASRHVPGMIFMGDIAKTNPSYIVDGRREPRKVSNRVVPPPGQDVAEQESFIRDVAWPDDVDPNATTVVIS